MSTVASSGFLPISAAPTNDSCPLSVNLFADPITIVLFAVEISKASADCSFPAT